MSIAHRTAVRAAALILAGPLALGACGSATTSTSTTTTVVTATTTTTATPATPGVGNAPLKIVDTPYGKAIGRGDGHVLYAWDKEAAAGNTISCVAAACLEKWPPLTATEVKVADGLDAKAFSLVARPDGAKQVAINGRALYAMSADEAGDANCQGLEGWWILNPDGTKNTNTTATKP